MSGGHIVKTLIFKHLSATAQKHCPTSMNRIILPPLFATIMLLGSCARAELDVPEIQTEVSYCVVSVKTPRGGSAATASSETPEPAVQPAQTFTPRTKSTYDTAQSFGAWAWYLSAGKVWDKDKKDAIPYIGSSTSAEKISHSDGQWKSTTHKYYWPKAGSLSFFAYSPYALPENAGTVSCDKKDGISLSNYKIASQCDFLVADPATDKTAAETTYGLNGVPTLFRHALSKVTVKATLEKEFTGGKKVIIKGITLGYLYLTASYKCSATPQWTPQTTSLGSQTLADNSKDISTLDVVEVGSVFVIPQTFGQRDAGVYPEITINYIDEKNEPQTATRKIYDLSTKATSFEPGRHYIYTISFGTSDQPIIFGGQSVEDWVVKGSDSIQY